MYPTVAGAVVPIYNLPTVAGSTADPPLVLTPGVLARVFRAALTRWDDPEIAALNPQLAASGKLPATDIRLVVRSDFSGTSEIFTRALSSFEAGDTAATAVSATPNWTSPDVLTCSTNHGVAACVMNTPYAIGYVVLAEAVALSIPFASLLTDPARDPVVASVQSVAASLAELGVDFGNTGEAASRLTANVHHARGPLAWPIVGLTYAVLRKSTTLIGDGQSCESRRETVKFWEWFYTSEDLAILAERKSFATLPAVTRDLVLSRLQADVQCDGAPAYTAPAPATLRGGGSTAISSMMRSFEVAYATRLDIVTGLDIAVTITFEAYQDTDSAVAALTNGLLDYVVLPLGTPATSGALPAETYIEVPYAGYALAAIASLCTSSSTCLTQNQILVLDLEAVAALVNGSLTQWLDPRLVALNPWMGVEPYTSFIGAAREIALTGESAASETNQVLLRMLHASNPSATLTAFEPGGRARIEADAGRVRAAIASTPFALGFTPMVDFSDAQGLSVAAVLSPVSAAPIAPTWEAVGVCADNWADDGTFGLEDVASLPASCYPLSYALAVVSPRAYAGDACNQGEVVLRFLSWLTRDEQKAAMRVRSAKPLVAVAALPIHELLLQAECIGRGPLLYLHVELNLIGTALHVLAYSIAGVLMAWLIWFTVWSRIHRSHVLIKSGQIGFMRIVTSGLLLTLASGCATMRDHSDTDPDLSVPLGDRGRYPALDVTCEAEVWLYFLGISITYSALMTKLMRATKVLINPTMRDVKVPAIHYFLLVAFVTSVTVLLLAIWSAVAPPYYRLEVHLPDENGIEKWYGGCEFFPNDDILFPIALSVVQLAVMLNAAYFCYLARKLNPLYAESRAIAHSISSFLIPHAAAVVIGSMSYPFSQAGGSPMIYLACRWLAPVISCCATIGILYVPRVAQWYELGEKRQVTFSQSSLAAMVVPPRVACLQIDGMPSVAPFVEAPSAEGHVVPTDTESGKGSVTGSVGNTYKGHAKGGKSSAKDAKTAAYVQKLELTLATCQAELLDARDDLTELRERNNHLLDEIAAAQRNSDASDCSD